MSSDLPLWTGFLTPLLESMDEGSVYARRELYDLVANHLGLTPIQKSETIGSGGARYKNRIGWAINYLRLTGALTRPARGQYAITPGGKMLNEQLPYIRTEAEVDRYLLKHDIPGLSPSSEESQAPSKPEPQAVESLESSELDPYEQVQTGIDRIQSNVARELLVRLHQNDPGFFEQSVVDLVVAMG